MTTKEALIWCKKHDAKVKPVSFDDGTLWFARMQLNGETMVSASSDCTVAIIRLRRKFQKQIRSEAVRTRKENCYEHRNRRSN